MMMMMMMMMIGRNVAPTNALINAPKGAIEMKAEDFERFLATTSTKVVVGVKFYAPWCGHCKKVAPEWDAFASNAKDERAVVLKLDGSKNEAKDVMKRFNVRGFPTFYFFGDGEMTEFSGERTREGFEAFARIGRKSAAIRRKYAYNEQTGKIMFGKPSLKQRVLELVKDGARDLAQIVSAKPGLALSIFVVGVWTGACAVGGMFFLAGDWAAAQLWRDHVKRVDAKSRAALAAASADKKSL